MKAVRTSDTRLPSSFRDPSGFLFRSDGVLYRQVNGAYAESYVQLRRSGLYDELVGEGLLVPHQEVDRVLAATEDAWKVLRPDDLDFVSYPFEWCFSQLRDAALLTLEIQRRALEHGMVLKDASAYNVQFRGGKPVFIDTLSFERYEEGRPWVAYRQFCEHFLGPLALMSHVDPRLGRLLAIHVDGVPLELVARLLPLRSRLRPSLLLHIHLHAAGQRHLKRRAVDRDTRAVSRPRLKALLGSLRSAVEGLAWSGRTPWVDYYAESGHYSRAAARRKLELVDEYLGLVNPRTAWDLGANTGRFSEVASRRCELTVSFDADPGVVEHLYRRCRDEDRSDLLPLCMDLANPSPGLGWAHDERDSLLERGPADVVLALALVHHLRLAHNVPFPLLARFLHRAGRWAVVEFIPKDDPRVVEMLALRADVFADYTRDGFEAAFDPWFEPVRRDELPESGRALYLFRGREGHGG